MQNNDNVTSSSIRDKKITLALFAYNQVGLDRIIALVNESGLNRYLDIVSGDLNRHESVNCDIAVAAITSYDNVERYIYDITNLHNVRRIPAVFAVICEDAIDKIASNRSMLMTPNIIDLPIDPQQFIKLIMTQVVSIKILKEKQYARKYGAKPRQLGEILVENQLISFEQLQKALDYQKNSDMRIGEVLVALGFIDDEQKNHFLASQLGVELATPKQYASASLDTVALIPERIARRNTCIALEKNNDVLTVAMLEVLDLQLLDSLRDTTGCTIVPILGTKDDINASIERYYRDLSSQQDATDLVADLSDEMEYVSEEEEETSVEQAVTEGADLGIVKLVNMLIMNAVRDKASDIHIEPEEKTLKVRFRIDGDLRIVMNPPKQSHQAIITRIKILSNLDIAERRLPQDGRMVVKIGKREVDIRVSILPTIFGEKAVLRILDKEAFEKSIANLGFSKANIEQFKEQISKPYGMIIVTGPTGSGKSTTLYSAIQEVKDVSKNIITVEDPVEFHMEGVSQIHVRSEIGLTFASALRSILRQDPDIILIGEIRDQETADIAVKMALTGHLVFSTLHTNDASSTIARFVDIGIQPLLLGSALNIVIAQRLIRRICDKCKTQYSPDPELIEQLHLEHLENPVFYKGEGCVNCNGTGYRGRIGIFEMLNVTKPLRKLILRNAPTIEIQELAEKEGMKTLRMAGIEKILAGETTIEQVLASTSEL